MHRHSRKCISKLLHVFEFHKCWKQLIWVRHLIPDTLLRLFIKSSHLRIVRFTPFNRRIFQCVIYAYRYLHCISWLILFRPNNSTLFGGKKAFIFLRSFHFWLRCTDFFVTLAILRFHIVNKERVITVYDKAVKHISFGILLIIYILIFYGVSYLVYNNGVIFRIINPPPRRRFNKLERIFWFIFNRWINIHILTGKCKIHSYIRIFMWIIDSQLTCIFVIRSTCNLCL